MKTYSRHYCTQKHRTWYTTAKCLWPRAWWWAWHSPQVPMGTEPIYALVSRCRGVSVSLHSSQASAERDKATIDSSLCSGGCYGNHEIIKLDPAMVAGR